jgi:hypothetical protein
MKKTWHIKVEIEAVEDGFIGVVEARPAGGAAVTKKFVAVTRAEVKSDVVAALVDIFE